MYMALHGMNIFLNRARFRSGRAGLNAINLSQSENRSFSMSVRQSWVLRSVLIYSKINESRAKPTKPRSHRSALVLRTLLAT